MKLTKTAEEVLKSRYFLKDDQGQIIENFDLLIKRVAHAIAMADKAFHSDAHVTKTFEQFYELMYSLKFLPNTPTLMNAGTQKGQLAACFVLPIEDSLISIFDTLKYTALIHQSGGGTGFSFSRLRPKGDIVKSTHGISSGPVSFMKIFDMATSIIKQGGKRRGANMGILRIDHPDILEFISCKESTEALKNFNISVGVTKPFIEALKNKDTFELVNPRTNTVTKKIYAEELFDYLSHYAWKTGDPGIINLHSINLTNPTPYLGEIEATNPCLTGDAWVTTKGGPKKIKELNGKKAKILLNGQFYSTDNKGFFLTGKKKVFEVITDRGYRLKATDEHLFLVACAKKMGETNTTWKKLRDLKEKRDFVILSNNRDIQWKGYGTYEEGYLMGLLIGNGCIKEEHAIISLVSKDYDFTDVIHEMEKSLFAIVDKKDLEYLTQKNINKKEYVLQLKSLHKLALRFALSKGYRGISYEIEAASSDFYKGFLKALYDTKSTIEEHKKYGIRLKLSLSDMDTLLGIQRMLLRIGIASKIYENVKNLKHRLIISDDNAIYFLKAVGFANKEKQKMLEEKLLLNSENQKKESFIAKVKAIIPKDEEDVFDVTVPVVNAFEANGVIVHNCGEQPLLPYESCTLGSINLTAFIKNIQQIDYDELEKTVYLAVHFLDNVVELNKYPIKEIEEMTKKNRKIGIGIMGFADLLIMLNIPYESQKALNLASELMKFITEKAVYATQELAKKRGPFPAFSGSIYAKKNEPPRRNATVTTIAPTGTISIIAGVSSGIEPNYAFTLKRQILDTQFEEIHPIYLKYLKEGKKINPSIFATAYDISPLWHLKMQEAFQKYTENAVSKTINLPEDAKEEEVRKIFLTALEMGLKGVTIYRNKSRPKQTLNFCNINPEKECS